jgi:predicted negative regulator of RcsB-dependent stress response
MKNNILLISAFILIAAVSLFAYQQSNKAQNAAAKAISDINLEYYTRRGTVQKKPLAPITKQEELKTQDDTKERPSTAVDLAPGMQAADALFEKNSKEAAARYEQLLQQDPGYIALQLRLGMIYLKLKQYDAAKEHLYFVYEHKESGLQPDAAWFLALLHLSEQNKEKAVVLLKECVEKKCNYKKEAAAFLQIV